MTYPRYGGPDPLSVALERTFRWLDAASGSEPEEHRCDHCYGFVAQWQPGPTSGETGVELDVECDRCAYERADAVKHTGMQRRRVDPLDPWSLTEWVPVGREA